MLIVIATLLQNISLSEASMKLSEKAAVVYETSKNSLTFAQVIFGETNIRYALASFVAPVSTPSFALGL